MIAQLTKGEKGIAEYLRTGHSKHSRYTRDEKDERIPLMGSLQAIEDSQNAQLANPKSKQKYNYYHASLSFTREEWEKIEKEGNIQEIIDEYLKLNFPNHSKDEMILYAEAQIPIIQSEPYIPREGKDTKSKRLNAEYEGKEIGRSPHVHLIISFENMKFSRGIKTAGMVYSKDRSQMIASAIKFKSIVQDIVCEKFGLDNPEPLGLSRSELLRQYESFRKAAMVEKGKPRIEQEIDQKHILPLDRNLAETKDIALDEIKNNTKNSVIANEIVKAIDPEVRAQNVQLAETLKSKDVNLFIPTLKAKFGVDIRSNEDGTRIRFETITPKTRKPSTQNRNVLDYCTKQLNLRFDDAVKMLSEIALEQESLSKNLKNTDTIELSVSSDFKLLQGSTKEKPKPQAVFGWKTILTNPQNLENTLKQYSAISMAKFSNGSRNNANISGFTKTLIFDIDNKEAHQDMKISDGIELLKRKGIQGFIYPSSSHLYDGKTEKFRMIVPTTKALQDKDIYKDYMHLVVRNLGLEGKIDTVSDTSSQCYYQPLKKDNVILVDGKTFDNSEILRQASLLKEAKIEQGIENQAFGNIDQIRKGIDATKKFELQHEPIDDERYLTRVSLQSLHDRVPLYDLVRYFEPNATIHQEGKNQIMHTKEGRHLYIQDQNSAYSFKKGEYVTPYTYLQKRMNEAASEIKYQTSNENILKLGIQPQEEKSFNPKNPNEISKFFSRKLSKYWRSITSFNFIGFTKSLNRLMTSWNDHQGKKLVMDHYGLNKFDIFDNSLNVGYWGSIKKSDLLSNGLDQRFNKPEIEIKDEEQTKKYDGIDF
ncbi:hypothetical protein H7R39_06965 [Campylobacter sp. Marseille-Q3452]|uniref:Uncharacterized protein n=1 Tax=Campylobacter massiliensis TaxID=2762557 RepID=A0A842JAJ2_9BACT|nr:hypothetical protein [Campylobacter massiliensis]MBC2882999.1 hypothetical protein [Campylobacter massiliensis]